MVNLLKVFKIIKNISRYYYFICLILVRVYLLKEYEKLIIDRTSILNKIELI